MSVADAMTFRALSKVAVMLAALMGVASVVRPEPVVGALALVQDGFGSVGCEPRLSDHAHIVLQHTPMPAATGCAQSLRSETAGWDGKSSVQEPAGGGV
jgi:hypothetical protein